MKVVDPVTLNKVQKTLQSIAEPVVDMLNKLHQRALLNSAELGKAITDYYESGNDFVSVEKELIDGEVKLLKALERVHSAIYPTQDVINKVQRNWYEEIRRDCSESQLLLKSLKVEILDANIFRTIGISAEDRKREVLIAMTKAEILVDRIKMEFAGAKEKLEWLKEQLNGLNRVDSKIRLAQKIGESSYYQNLTYQGEITL